jgi:hypothetical protein
LGANSHPMIRRTISIMLVVTVFGVTAAVVAFFLKPQVVVPSVKFTGYTNSALGLGFAFFEITNRTSETLELKTGLCLSEREQSQQHVVSSYPFTASRLRVAPGQAATVSIPRPPSFVAPWRASFDFVPATHSVTYRLKRYLHQMGARIDVTPPTVSATSDVVYLTIVEAVESSAR